MIFFSGSPLFFSSFVLGLALVQAMSGKEANGSLLGVGESDDSSDDDDAGHPSTKYGVSADNDSDGTAKNAARSSNVSGDENSKGGDDAYFAVPSNLSSAGQFKGITKNKKACEVEVTIRLPSR